MHPSEEKTFLLKHAGGKIKKGMKVRIEYQDGSAQETVADYVTHLCFLGENGGRYFFDDEFTNNAKITILEDPPEDSI